MNEGSQRRPKAGVRMTDVPVGASRPIHDRLVPLARPSSRPRYARCDPEPSFDPTIQRSNGLLRFVSVLSVPPFVSSVPSAISVAGC